MRAGGVRAAIFAVFTPSIDEVSEPVARDDDVIEFPLAGEVPHGDAAAFAAAAAGRLIELERAGLVRVARTTADLDAAHDDDGPPAAVLHLEGAEAIDPDLESLALWYAAGCDPLAPSGAGPTDSRTGCRSSRRARRIRVPA